MTIFAEYFSPTTPGNASFTVDVSGAIRLGSITGLGGEARLGATGNGNLVFDDPTSTLGHSSDGILGLKQLYINETACPVGNQRLWTGYIADRTYRRGPDQTSSLRTGVARQIDTTLVDVNDFLSFRVFAPEDVDPTSSFVRPAETDLERVQGLLADVDFLSTTLFDIGYIPSTGGVDLDANDYTGQRPIDVLNDCAQASGRNFWVKYDEAGNQLVLWYDVWTTDGSATLTYDSALKLTNVLSEVNGTTVFAAIDPEETLDPSRLVAGVYLPYTGGTAYGTFVATSYTYAWRDAVMPSVSTKSSGVADALVARYLGDNSTEDSTIRCSVQLPAAKVTGIHEGMRLQVHFTHLPSVNAGMTWTRVLSRTIRVDVETQQFYWLDLELSPITAGTEPGAILYRAESADNSTGGTSQIGWLCAGSGADDGLSCNSGSFPVDPTTGPVQAILGTFGGTIGTINYLGLTILGTGTIDFEWGTVATPLQVFTAAGGITVTVELRKNGAPFTGSSSVLVTPGGGSGHTMPPIVVTGVSVLPGDVFSATFYHSGGATLYIDGGNLEVTGGLLA